MAEIGFTVNGRWVAADDAHRSALDLIRDQLGLTGAKRVCGIGGCGACTVLVDGVPTETCTLEPAAVEGTAVMTVEGLSTEGELTALQKAMVAHDAVQCGFCTPGVVLSAETFVAQWRTTHGTTVPDQAAVVEALDGHLCRCGAYPGIVEAVRATASGEHYEASVPRGRPDAAVKTTGEARFTVDVALAGMLEGKVLRSALPHAKVLDIDPASALALPGVKAVVELVGKDREVRYVGQPIAAVAAVDEPTARAGTEAIDVRYEPLPAAVGMQASRADDAPNLIGRRMFLVSSYEAGVVAATVPRRGNMRGPMGLLSKRRFTARRRIREARNDGDPLLIEGRWMAASQAHAAAEPHSAVASWDGDALTMHLSTQSVTATATRLAKHFGLNRGSVRVLADHVGGAFGAKQGLTEPSVAAAELARAANAPVRVVFDPEEELAYGGYRPGAELELAILADSNGSLRAIESTGHMDSGDSAGQTVAGVMRISYPGPPMALTDYDVISNGAPARPFQAPGSPIALFALESAVDELAARLGTDPISLRRGWNPRKGRQVLYDWAESHPLWASRTEPAANGKLRGVGVAFGSWHYAYDPSARVKVWNDDSGLLVETGVQDLGTGTRATLAQAVALVFGLDSAEVRVKIGDSSLTRGTTSSASRTTPSVFPTAKAAAAALHQQLLAEVSAELGMGGAQAADGGVDHAGEFISWSELWPRLGNRSATSRRPRDKRFSPQPIAIEGVKFGFGVSDVAHLIEVEVDDATGHIQVAKASVALAAGKIHTPSQATSQVHGALARGIGEALLEERLTDPETGQVTTASYDRYRILRMREMPEVEVEFFEEGFDHVPEGGVGIAELPITSVPGAVANAVAAATGWRPRHMPMTPERVVAGFRSGRRVPGSDSNHSSGVQPG